MLENPAISYLNRLWIIIYSYLPAHEGRFSDYSATGTLQRFQWRVGKLAYTTISMVSKSKSFY
jgi:hypothetical protein